MKRVLLTVLSVLLCSLGYGQALVVDSTRFLTGINHGTYIYYSIPTSDKGLLCVGGATQNPGGIIPYFPIDPYGGNVLVCKIDSNQQISWIKVFGGSQGDGARAACQTSDGGYAILANTESSDGQVTGFKGLIDMWLLKLDKDGNLLWQKCYGSSQDDGAVSIANTIDNGLILFGTTNGTDGDVPNHYGSFYGVDWLVIKTDSAGNIQWSKDLGTTEDEAGSGIILSVDSAYYLVSAAISGDHDCTDTVWHAGVNTSYDFYILKLGASGNVLWDSSYGGSSSDGAYGAIFDERDSTIVAVGITYSNDYKVTGYHGGYGDIWMIKVNKKGKLQWQKALGSGEDEQGTGLCASRDGGYVAYGPIHTGPIGQQDCWLSFLDNNGNEIANKTFGGIIYEIPNSIVPYHNGYVATGVSSSNVFTEGKTGGRNCIGQEGFWTYISHGSTAVGGLEKPLLSLIVYPNPSTEYVVVQLPNKSPGMVTVMNGIGQKIISEHVDGIVASLEVNLTKWESGLYVVIWKSEEGSVMIEKFIKR